MNLLDAIHAAVHDYQGGAESLAPRFPMSPVVLRSKVNPNMNTHHVTVRDLDKILALTGDYRPLYALAANHNHVCVPLMDGPIGDLAILERITDVWKEVGDVGQLTQAILADSKVERGEVDRLKTEVQHATSALLALQFALEALQE